MPNKGRESVDSSPASVSLFAVRLDIFCVRDAPPDRAAGNANLSRVALSFRVLTVGATARTANQQPTTVTNNHNQ